MINSVDKTGQGALVRVFKALCSMLRASAPLCLCLSVYVWCGLCLCAGVSALCAVRSQLQLAMAVAVVRVSAIALRMVVVQYLYMELPVPACCITAQPCATIHTQKPSHLSPDRALVGLQARSTSTSSSRCSSRACRSATPRSTCARPSASSQGGAPPRWEGVLREGWGSEEGQRAVVGLGSTTSSAWRRSSVRAPTIVRQPPPGQPSFRASHRCAPATVGAGRGASSKRRAAWRPGMERAALRGMEQGLARGCTGLGGHACLCATEQHAHGRRGTQGARSSACRGGRWSRVRPGGAEG
jgi:hypothetical protein